MFAGLQQLPDLASGGICGSLGVGGGTKTGKEEKSGQEFHWAKVICCYQFDADFDTKASRDTLQVELSNW